MLAITDANDHTARRLHQSADRPKSHKTLWCAPPCGVSRARAHHPSPCPAACRPCGTRCARRSSPASPRPRGLPNPAQQGPSATEHSRAARECKAPGAAQQQTALEGCQREDKRSGVRTSRAVKDGHALRVGLVRVGAQVQQRVDRLEGGVVHHGHDSDHQRRLRQGNSSTQAAVSLAVGLLLLAAGWL